MKRTVPHAPSARVRALSAAHAERDLRASPSRAQAGAGEAQEEERACQLLAIGTPAEVLARIVPEDSLGLRPRLGAHLARHALFLDAERLLLRCQALCALHAPAWRGEPHLEAWLEERVVEAVAGFLTEEGEPGKRDLGGTFESFAAPLALDPGALAQACARFNRLPIECREAFVALVLERDGVVEGADGADRLARARGISLSELARRARNGVELFRVVVAATPAPPRQTRVGEGRS